MYTLLIKQPYVQLSHKNRTRIIDLAVYLFIILFMYTAASKLFTIKSFAATLAKSPLIGDYDLLVAWAVPLIEMGITFLLIMPFTRKAGMTASLSLMVTFTVYLLYMVLSEHKLPCHCGGAISNMTWQQHIWFNVLLIILAASSLVLINKKK